MCDICRKDAPTKHIDIYTWGSEGVNICTECEIRLAETLRELAMQDQDRRKAKYLAERNK